MHFGVAMSVFYLIDGTSSIHQTLDQTAGLSLAAGDRALILSTGSVVSSGSNAVGILASGDYTNITTAGLVYGSTIGIQLDSSISVVGVTGQVLGGNVGIVVNGNGNSITVGAGGSVNGVFLNGASEFLTNGGSIDAPSVAIMAGATSRIVNNGLIVSHYGQAIYYTATSGSTTIVNAGTILGDVQIDSQASVAQLDITNTGQLIGKTYAGAGADSLVNLGTIKGAVSLGAGVDTFDSSLGHLYGIVRGGDGNDKIIGSNDDNDLDGGAGADILDGRGGIDTVWYDNSIGRVVVDLALHIAKGGDAAGDKLISIENVVGTGANDVLTGDANNNVLNGLVGKDLLTGGDGDDTLISLGGGKSTFNGGNGDDAIQLLDPTAGVYGKPFSANVKIDGGTGFDALELSGDYSSGINMKPTTITNIEQLTLDAGFSYKLTMDDANVGAGQTLNVDALQLDSVHMLTFNGGAETDGRFVVEGGDGKDVITGGAGDDVINGGMAADTLTGGGGHDSFVYSSAAESTSKNYDILIGFDANNDTFELSVGVANIDAAITNVSLSTAGFDGALKTATNGHLLANDAILVTATAGTLSGHVFLVVDANGSAGYQNGADYVFDVTGMTGTLTSSDFTI